MRRQIRLADFQTLTPKDKTELLTRLASDATIPANGPLTAVNARIHAYEQRYEMKSAELGQRLRKKEIRETADIAKWLFLLGVRAKGGKKTRTEQTQ